MSSQAVPARLDNMGLPVPRIDGRDKVSGRAQYPADVPLQNPAFAFLVTSTIAKGRVASVDKSAALRVAGVLAVMTYEDLRGELHPPTFWMKGGTSSTTIRPLATNQVFYDGQIVALAVAETFEAAREAAQAVKIAYDGEAPSATFGSPGVVEKPVSDVNSQAKDPSVGHFDEAFAAAEIKFEATYSTPTQHHNPIELFSTSCVWNNDQLTIYEPSQFVYGLQKGVSEQLAIPQDKIRVISTYVGGAFGSKGSTTPRTAIVAAAARKLQRPVKLVMSRAQGFTCTTYRAETRHRVRIGADAAGRFTAMNLEGFEVTSRPDAYAVAGTATTARLYKCPNISTRVSIVHADRATPGFMRSPPEVPYVYALESAIDELAGKLDMDPIELRRVNDTMNEPIKGLPYTSRSLMKCFDQAAAAFGWSKRTKLPGSMRDGDWLIGWGCATAVYPSHISAAAARVRLTADGFAHVDIAAHDVGTGTYTVVAQTVADRLGVTIEKVQVLMADTRLPPAPVSGGSNVTASACNAVVKACDAVRDRLTLAARRSETDPTGNEAAKLESGKLVLSSGKAIELKTIFDGMGAGAVEEYAEFVPAGSKPGSMQTLYDGGSPLTGGLETESQVQAAFGAEFVEVRVHRLTREVRVPRAVGAFAAGHIVNPRTAHSQLMGGMIWGISSALFEDTEIDRRNARLVNTNLADYLIPVNADIRDVEIILVPERDDKVNPLGIKGIGELANVGTAAAVTNAVYHATGKRIRDLPVRIEKLLDV